MLLRFIPALLYNLYINYGVWKSKRESDKIMIKLKRFNQERY